VLTARSGAHADQTLDAIDSTLQIRRRVDQMIRGRWKWVPGALLRAGGEHQGGERRGACD
jgi:hypothetical protein